LLPGDKIDDNTEENEGCDMIIASVGAVGDVVGAVFLLVLAVLFLKASLKVVQQGSVGVVKRFGEFRTIRMPGLHMLLPFADRMDKVDIREFPHTGDQQAVITQDNVSLWVSATIFCQVTDVKLALFEIDDYSLAIDQMSRTALRAVFGELTLDQSLSERETINTKMQDHMAEATLKWGVRLNRIEILDITPPGNVLQAMSEQKEAEQHKRAAILKSEGEQQAAINSAQGRKQANVLEAEGQKQAAILGAEAQKQVLELRADGEKRAAQLRGEGEAAALMAIDAAVIRPNTLAVTQLRALREVATSQNAKIVVPYEAAGLVGAAQVLVDALKDAGDPGVSGANRPPTIVPGNPPPPR
jgi:regulator of protease activity HflC (stomatin/prohibitin superfamily)